jgi:tetratricopeptide (TPR) repeat protein
MSSVNRGIIDEIKHPFLAWANLSAGTCTSGRYSICFDESSYDLGSHNSEKLVNISAASPEPSGVPSISAPKYSEALLFPASKTYKTVGEIKDEFDYRVWQKKGMILFNLGRYDEALQEFDQSIQMNPKIAESWSYKGFALRVTHQNREAIKFFDVATAPGPSFITA